jgi:hypothetical protein
MAVTHDRVGDLPSWRICVGREGGSGTRRHGATERYGHFGQHFSVPPLNQLLPLICFGEIFEVIALAVLLDEAQEVHSGIYTEWCKKAVYAAQTAPA